jgi:hypothetical protein
MSTLRIPFDKPAHAPGPMTSTMGEENVVLTCLDLACENRVQTTNLQQNCQGVCHGTAVVLTCSESAEGEWQKL